MIGDLRFEALLGDLSFDALLGDLRFEKEAAGELRVENEFAGDRRFPKLFSLELGCLNLGTFGFIDDDLGGSDRFVGLLGIFFHCDNARCILVRRTASINTRFKHFNRYSSFQWLILGFSS